MICDTPHEGVFDTNVYVAEALLGEAAERMIQATRRGAWRIYVSTLCLTRWNG